MAATIIDGGGSGSVVNFIEGDTSTLKGFTIRNRNRLGYGGGIYIRESSPVITGNTITGNKAEYGGGGISVNFNSFPTITNNTITYNNTINGGGGGISVYDSSPTISNNTITGNTVSDKGGGIYVSSSGDLLSCDLLPITSRQLAGVLVGRTLRLETLLFQPSHLFQQKAKYTLSLAMNS